ncbi:BNR domain-containing protein [Pseudomonas syringae]|uniref:WD40/YVTN/BNR-like repeat-containing protein n=1 Tax=Pseudomonas syringae TaxID=317 RepID=UPI001FD957F3|nr:YCF48-related protein [Pseudomonas syringae]MCI3945865.1 BNR domain-containing protein [Pseudomonas syringae]
MLRAAHVLALGLLLCSGSLLAVEAPVGDVLLRPAIKVDEPEHAVLIGLGRAGPRLVAVGAQGLIIVSDDGGKAWRQVPVPVSVTLTAVDFATPHEGWAVGHAGSILHTSDGGESWQLQLDGRAAAQRVLAAVPKDTTADPALLVQQRVAERFVQEGPDKPLLAVQFSDAQNGIVAGAFGLLLHTADGGQTWVSWVDRADNADGYHLYAIARRGSHIYVAGEQGVLLESTDAGEHFQRLQSPYEGSFFALQLDAGGAPLLAGLRGNAWRSNGQAPGWQRLDTDAQSALVGIVTLSDGRTVLAEQNGRLLQVDDAAARLRVLSQAEGFPVAAVVQAADGALVVAGPRGVKRLGVLQ